MSKEATAAACQQYKLPFYINNDYAKSIVDENVGTPESTKFKVRGILKVDDFIAQRVEEGTYDGTLDPHIGQVRHSSRSLTLKELREHVRKFQGADEERGVLSSFKPCVPGLVDDGDHTVISEFLPAAPTSQKSAASSCSSFRTRSSTDTLLSSSVSSEIRKTNSIGGSTHPKLEPIGLSVRVDPVSLDNLSLDSCSIGASSLRSADYMPSFDEDRDLIGGTTAEDVIEGK